MAHLPISEGTANLASAALFDRYRERIYRYILSMAKDATESEDLVQETFLRAHGQLAFLRDPATVSAWLFRIATNVTYDRLRQRTREKALRAPGMESGGQPDGENLADPGASSARTSTSSNHTCPAMPRNSAYTDTCLTGFTGAMRIS